MPATLASLHAEIDWSRFDKQSQKDALKKAIEAGHFSQMDRHLSGMSRVGFGLGYLNGGHVFNLDAL